MYAELELKLFMTVSKPAITEAPPSIIPPVNTMAAEQMAIDLMTRHSDEEKDGTIINDNQGESLSDNIDNSTSLNS